MYNFTAFQKNLQDFDLIATDLTLNIPHSKVYLFMYVFKNEYFCFLYRIQIIFMYAF